MWVPLRLQPIVCGFQARKSDFRWLSLVHVALDHAFCAVVRTLGQSWAAQPSEEICREPSARQAFPKHD